MDFIALVMDMFIRLNWMIISQWNADQIITFDTGTPYIDLKDLSFYFSNNEERKYRVSLE